LLALRTEGERLHWQALRDVISAIVRFMIGVKYLMSKSDLISLFIQGDISWFEYGRKYGYNA